MNKNTWQRVKLGEIAEIISGGTPKTSSCHTEALGEVSQKNSTLKDISLVSQAQYDKQGKQ